MLVADVGKAQDASQIQIQQGPRQRPALGLSAGHEAGRRRQHHRGGQRCQGRRVANLLDVPKRLVTEVVFDQSVFVRTAIETLIHEGAIGLVLTGLMILVFLGSMRATVAVFLSIPLSALAAFIALAMGGNTINAMILGGLALAFSRLIDNSVVVLENIFRHLEMGESPDVAAERGGQEVALPVLAATLTTVVVFFPVTFLYGVSRFLFTALALSVVLSLFASYFVAMTVVPLFCAKLIKGHGADTSWGVGHRRRQMRGAQRFNAWFNRQFNRMLDRYEGSLNVALAAAAGHRPRHHRHFRAQPGALSVYRQGLLPAHRPGQFVINRQGAFRHADRTDGQIGRPSRGHRARRGSEAGPQNHRLQHRHHPRFFRHLQSQFRPHTAFVQVGLNDGHRLSSFAYMNLVRARLRRDLPQVSAYFQTGGLVDAILNQGHARAAGHSGQQHGHEGRPRHRQPRLRNRCARCPASATCWCRRTWIIPALKVDIDRERASELGLSAKEVRRQPHYRADFRRDDCRRVTGSTPRRATTIC